MSKIIGVYKITNTVTGDTYVGSSIDVHRRWLHHKSPSIWANKTNKMYVDMQTYGVDKFKFIMLFPVEEQYLKQVEQEAIELFNPTYNRFRAKIENPESYQTDYYEEHKNQKLEYAKSLAHKMCNYNGETLTFGALKERFRRMNFEHPTLEAKKYLI